MAALLLHISVCVKSGAHELLKMPHSAVHVLPPPETRTPCQWSYQVSLCSTVVVQPLVALPFLRTFYLCGDHARKDAIYLLTHSICKRNRQKEEAQES